MSLYDLWCHRAFLVPEVKCNAPYFPPHFNRPNFSCSSLFGSSFTLQCKSRGRVITNQSHLLYLCSSNGFWVPAISYFEIPCSEHNTPSLYLTINCIILNCDLITHCYRESGHNPSVLHKNSCFKYQCIWPMAIQ